MFYQQFIKLCNEAGVKPTPLVKSLGLSAGNIKRWENGATINSDILLKLSEHFKVSIDYLLTGKEKSSSADLTADEQELLTYYKKLSDLQKGIVIGRAETLVALDAAQLEQPKCKTIFIEIYNLPVSAGTGIYLDSEDKDIIEVPLTSLSEKANFALRIKGDSMTPKYDDGDIILIKTQPCVDIDEIGVFILNGKGYVKKFKGDRLESCNENYPDIIINEFDSCYCKGKIIGKL